MSLDTATPIRLSELAGIIYQVIDEVFKQQSFWVVADIANHSFKPASSHHYFDLVEKDQGSAALISRIPTRSWADGSSRIAAFEQATGQKFGNDLRVLVQVSIFYHAVYGLQLTLTDIDTGFTLGALEQQKQATLLRLVKDNTEHIRLNNGVYSTSNQQLRLPAVIQNIAVISSSTSAGLEDFLHTLNNNAFNYRFRTDTYNSVVQGELNAQVVVDQLIAIYNAQNDYDAVVLIRGGGAQTDLLLFEQYSIGRAIARFPIPVITGIGHQKNETVADLMAHTAVKTPTKAAEMIVAHNRAFSDELLSFEKNMIIRSQQILARQNRLLSQVSQQFLTGAGHYLSAQKQDLSALSSVLARRPGQMLYEKQKDLQSMVGRMGYASQYFLKTEQGHINNYAALIRLMSPENVMKKGFALIRQNGKIISDPASVSPGNQIDIILAGEEIEVIVNNKKAYDGRDFNL
ncbi:exodeoxyribonuclease VII large subunit [Mucilaginibacter jinjuensis]|uniref:Exodeoxyribonuclease 7 large subunit n=1 Tax=Mucilaginibacter jinjuensis TaxID=1176721 RepID=A0ABY7TDN4_9SPHI|nr:exodeoxyribonuclease VII large subunit [Mucilaginibacter jinjuensis]WCT14259.1 exodeoxyribonuclease VII large subunit [Mucilaginibacter jinjuensis]